MFGVLLQNLLKSKLWSPKRLHSKETNLHHYITDLYDYVIRIVIMQLIYLVIFFQKKTPVLFINNGLTFVPTCDRDKTAITYAVVNICRKYKNNKMSLYVAIKAILILLWKSKWNLTNKAIASNRIQYISKFTS